MRPISCSKLLPRIPNATWIAGLFCLVSQAAEPEERTSANAWRMEDPGARAGMPLYQVIPAAKDHALTPASTNEIHSKFSTGDWHRSHGGHANQRFSPLDQIHRDNVAQLEQAWIYHSKDGAGNIQCNPIAVDGLIYAPTVGGAIVAIDGVTGSERWRYQCDQRPAFRGLTYWKSDTLKKPRLLFNAGDWLYALDADSGHPLETFGNQGRVKTGHFRVAPAIYQDLILIAGYDGDAFAFDFHTGEKKWTFHTRPHEGELGHETLGALEAGANCWSGTALDDGRGIFFLTTGSPKPNFIGTGHWGDNLFSNCVLALNARTGARLWHVQEIRHDIWDLDIPAPPVLTTIRHEQRDVDAVAAVTKLGNTLLLDRVTGEPLVPFRLKRAPISKLHGERTAPYQPDLQWPQPFARQRFGINQITNLSNEAHESVLQQLRNDETGIHSNMGWFEPFEAGMPTALFGIHGGAEWTGASFDPKTGFLYVTSNELPWFPTVSRLPLTIDDHLVPPSEGRKIYETHCMACHGHSREGSGVHPPLILIGARKTEPEIRNLLTSGRNLMPAAEGLDEAMTDALVDYLLTADNQAKSHPRAQAKFPSYTYNGYPKLLDNEGFPGCKPPWGTLNCIDLNSGILRWQVPLGEHEVLTERGIPITGTENFGGSMTTAGGLVFAAGTRDLKIRAFDSATGEERWSHQLPFGGYAPAASYRADGKQYILIPSTGGGKLGGEQGDAYVAFTLP